MTKVKIEDLTNKQLDHFCAIAQGYTIGRFSEILDKNGIWIDFYPTTNAEQCMEIMEREKIGVYFTDNENGEWIASIVNIKNDCGTKIIKHMGSTAKQAIIACFVKSKLGDKVDCENL